MRLIHKSTFALIVLYVVFVAGTAFWLGGELHSLSTTMVRNTARLVGNEIGATVSEYALDDLVKRSNLTRARLEKIVDNVTEHSEVIDSLALLDHDGRVLASDRQDEVGRQIEIPEQAFRGERSVEVPRSLLRLRHGQYRLWFPLLNHRSVLGYLRLSMDSRQIADLYYRARREFLFGSIIGLAGMAALGLLFHAQLSRGSARLADALERAIEGEAVGSSASSDEFTPAIELARQVGMELQEARQDRAETHRRFGALMKATEVGVILVRPDRELDFANTSARGLLGCAAPGELEEHWQELRGKLAELLDTCPSDGPAGARRDIELPWDQERPAHRLRIEAFRVREDSWEGYLLLVKNRDMMEALERELGLAVQMRGLARFHLAFVHDLKTPLNAMVLNLELLKQTLSAPGSEDDSVAQRQTRYIDVLGEEIARLDRQLQALLTHSALPSETTQDVDLRQLLEDLIALLAPQAKQQHVSVHATLPDEPVIFFGHGDRLKQAMLNISINGLQAMPDGGRLDIELEDRGEEAVISFRDTGAGIPPEVLEQIYNMHFTTKAGGTGIGLFVARAVVDSHGGKIRVGTRSGEGSCFSIHLPLSSQTQRTSR